MISVPLEDPVGALMPHTLKEPLLGRDSGPLCGRTFMVKDLFAVAGRKVSNGNPAWYAESKGAPATARAIQWLLDAGASLTGGPIPPIATARIDLSQHAVVRWPRLFRLLRARPTTRRVYSIISRCPSTVRPSSGARAVTRSASSAINVV